MTDLGRRWRLFEGRMLAVYADLVGATARWSLEGADILAMTHESDRPLVWATWHGMLYPAFMWGMRAMDTADTLAITVGDKRSDVLEGMIRGVGADTVAVDMGGSPVAAGRAVLTVVRHLKKGKQTFIMPDGPDGPAFSAKPGVFFLAQRARALVIPIGAWSRQAFEMRRWDRYLIPFPFAHIHVVLGNPISVDRHTTDAYLQEQIPAALHAVRNRARELAGKKEK